MACAYPQWRIPWTEALLGNGWNRHRLADVYEKRVHNDGIIIQRPEFEMIQSEYPDLARKIQQIPCGKCIQCRLAYSREWANRCIAELKTSSNAIFLTLTYSDEHLTFAPYVDPDDGTIDYRPVLVPRDLQLFLKRFRTYCDRELNSPGQRFFACGEYGEMNGRPHFHLILYNVPVQVYDGSHVFPTAPGMPTLFTSPMLEKLWPYGMSVFGDVTWQSCAYVSRYVVKKRKGKDREAQIKAQQQYFPDQLWQDEFVRMSRRPGIGRAYYESHKDEIYELDEMYLSINGSVQAVKPAKYFDKLFDIEHHLELKKLKRKRTDIGQNALKAQLLNTDLTEEEYLLMKLESKEEQAKRLLRPI